MAATAVPLSYSIAASTPHSGPYHVDNILVDNPTEQASRWSGGPVPEHGSQQWLLLRLDTLAVVHSITFGKFVNPHPCNMKNFKVFGGLSEDTLTEIIHSELKNDTTPETFELRHVNEQGILTPFRYIKVMPLSSHGNSFHVSIWHVALKGIKDEVFVEQVRMKYDQFRETTAMRYVLKFLRQRRFLGPYNTILARSGLQVEDPLITELHENVVLQGDWAKAEQNIQQLSQTDLFDEYRHSKQAYSVWKRLTGKDVNGDVPAPRGGHAMCVDQVGGMIYLFGGWDGKQSLDDFWAYDIRQDRWRVLSYHTALDTNAPGPRSCHRMVFDTRTGIIYVLGRLDDTDAQKLDTPPPAGDGAPPAAKPGPEFYRYHTRGTATGKWERMPDDQSGNAPPLVYDHQLVIDCEAQILYLYGGRVIDDDWGNLKCAGLYSYNIALGSWQLLQASPKPTSASTFSGGIIPARYAHSLVLDNRTQTLFIFGGKVADNATLSDMYTYHIPTKMAKQIFADMTRECGFDMETQFQRAVIDPQLQEIYMFSGLAQEMSRYGLQDSSPRMFRYHPPPGRWDEVQPLPDADKAGEPVPRYAHQVVYDTTSRTIYMHGGNAGVRKKAGDEDAMVDEEQNERLDDLWQMTLARTPREEVIRRATLLIRKQQFREMCEDVPHVKALNFLRTSVFPVVDQNDPAETESYRGLLSYLFTPSSPSMSSHPHLKTPSSGSEHEDSPPRKRSRPNTPEDSEMTTPIDTEPPLAASASAGSESAMVEMETTSKLKIPPFDVQLVRETEDPAERKEGAGVGAGTLVSQARFQQRNTLFEALLEFVSDDAKQPGGSLVTALDGMLATPWG